MGEQRAVRRGATSATMIGAIAEQEQEQTGVTGSTPGRTWPAVSAALSFLTGSRCHAIHLLVFRQLNVSMKQMICLTTCNKNEAVGDVALLNVLAGNEQTSILLALTAVRTLSSYELRNCCSNLRLDSFRDTSVLLQLIRRINEPDEENESWDDEDAMDSDIAPMNPVLRKDLLKIFKCATSSFPDTNSFAQFIRKRVKSFGYSIVGSQKEAIHSLHHASHLLVSDSGDLTQQQISQIYSSACLYPADTLYSLIQCCLQDEAVMPVVVRLISNELKSCASARASDWDQNLLVSVITQCLYFSRNPDVPQKLIRLISMIRLATTDDPVIRIESIVDDWSGIYGFVNDMAHLVQGLVLLMESEAAAGICDDKWTEIDVVALLKFFMDCLLDVCQNAEEKQRLLDAIDVIMRKHIQRKVTPDEIEQVTNMYQIEVNRLPICYLQPYTDTDVVNLFDPQSLQSVEIMLLVSMLDRNDLPTLFNQVDYPDEIFIGLLPFLTPDEFGRLYDYLVHFFDPTDVICCALRTYRHLMDQDKSLDWGPILTAFELVFRQHYQCGSNLERIPIDPPAEDTVIDDEEIGDSDNDSSSETSSERRVVRCRFQRKHQYFNAIQTPRKPYSLFHAMHLLLRLEYMMIPNPLHLIVRDMVKDFVTITSNRSDEWDNPLPCPIQCYISRTRLWLLLLPEQQEYLMQLDPLLVQCNKRMAVHPRKQGTMTRRV